MHKQSQVNESSYTYPVEPKLSTAIGESSVSTLEYARYARKCTQKYRPGEKFWYSTVCQYLSCRQEYHPCCHSCSRCRLVASKF